MKTNQMKTGKAIYSELVRANETVTVTCFSRDSKTGRGMQELYSGKRKISGMPSLEVLGMGKLKAGLDAGHPMSLVRGACFTFFGWS